MLYENNLRAELLSEHSETVRTTTPIPATCDGYYFELTLAKDAHTCPREKVRHVTIIIGLTQEECEVDM